MRGYLRNQKEWNVRTDGLASMERRRSGTGPFREAGLGANEPIGM
jgi:hypothetical protein